MIFGIRIIVRCNWCWETAEVTGPSNWPTAPAGWWIDTRNFYSAVASTHYCPRHAASGPLSY